MFITTLSPPCFLFRHPTTSVVKIRIRDHVHSWTDYVNTQLNTSKTTTTTTTTTTKKLRTHMRGHNFKPGDCMVTYYEQSSVRFYYFHVDTIFLHRPWIIVHVWHRLMKSVRKVKNDKRSRQQKLQSVFTTHARNRVITAKQYHACSNWRQPYWSDCTVSGQFSEGYSIAACMAMLLSNYPRVKNFHCNFLICVIFQNLCQTWSIYDLCRKMRYKNLDEKILQTSVLIILPYNDQIWNCDTS